ncbi:hypothetical protein ABKN59_006167 [Abortiporus biennis]
MHQIIKCYQCWEQRWRTTLGPILVRMNTENISCTCKANESTPDMSPYTEALTAYIPFADFAEYLTSYSRLNSTQQLTMPTGLRKSHILYSRIWCSTRLKHSLVTFAKNSLYRNGLSSLFFSMVVSLIRAHGLRNALA